MSYVMLLSPGCWWPHHLALESGWCFVLELFDFLCQRLEGTLLTLHHMACPSVKNWTIANEYIALPINPQLL